MPRRFAFPPQKQGCTFSEQEYSASAWVRCQCASSTGGLGFGTYVNFRKFSSVWKPKIKTTYRKSFPRPAPLWGHRGAWPALLWGHQAIPRGSPEAKPVREVCSHQQGQRRPSPGPTIRKAPNPAESFTRRYKVLPACREKGSQKRPSVG